MLLEGQYSEASEEGGARECAKLQQDASEEGGARELSSEEEALPSTRKRGKDTSPRGQWKLRDASGGEAREASEEAWPTEEA